MAKRYLCVTSVARCIRARQQPERELDAAYTAIWARDSHLPAPVIEWYVAHTIGGQSDLGDKRLNVVGGADLAGLPPTTIVSAQIDPLPLEGETLAKKLQGAGVDVRQRTYPGLTHAFFGMGSVVGQAKLAGNFAASRLIAAFAGPAGASATLSPVHS